MTEKICPECDGEGVVDQGTEDERRCPTCNGSGVVPDDGQGSEEVWNTTRTAPQHRSGNEVSGPISCPQFSGPQCDMFVSPALNLFRSLENRPRRRQYAPRATGTGAMLPIDPWVKAAECERVIRVVADPERRSVLISLRGLWLALGEQESVLDRRRPDGQVPVIVQIHAELMSLYKNAMN
jgi:hypothetical protein